MNCHILVDETNNLPMRRTPKAIRVFSKCRNELRLLPAFLKHYRGLGVDRFFIVDNDSTDGTSAYLAQQPDVCVFRTSGRFSEAHGGTVWLNALLREFGVGSWCVTVDIDELLFYPGSEHTGLPALTEHLDRNGFEALSCLLLDLYPSGPLCQAPSLGEDLMLASLYFDSGPYIMTPVDKCPGVLIRGGVRERVFFPKYRKRGISAKIYDAALHQLARVPMFRRTQWIDRRRIPPCLTKVPLVRWDEHTSYLTCNHWVSPKAVASLTGVLLHLKFLNDFHARVALEVDRREYYDDASEYRQYAATLGRDGDIALVCEKSVRFVGSEQLVQLGLMQDSSAWAARRTASSTL